MPAVASIFLVAALVCSVTIGPQMRPWTWGPAMLALALSLAASFSTFWRKPKFAADFGLIAMGTLVAGWFAWRAWISPVAELGQADLLLLVGAVGTFICVRGIERNPLAEQILVWGIALLLLANVIVLGRQVIDPTYSPIFRTRASPFPSGFYAHYNEAANYLIASSLIVAAAAMFGKHASGIRILWGVIAIAGLTAVYFTRSRGGILGAAVGSTVFVIAALIIARRNESRWFAPALVVIPFIALGIGGFLYSGWEESQEIRNSINTGKGIEGIMDNNCRLYFLGIALSCIGLHPLLGGGSRSYSWECFRFVDGKNQGDIITRKPEQVHNEIVQAATDYGLLGAGLLILLLVSLSIIVMVRLLLPDHLKESGTADAWRIGGVAALAGMLVQSNFSFVFHLMPGAILLGISLGQMAHSSTTQAGKLQVIASKIFLSGAALGCMVLLVPVGWRGSQVTRILWPTYFSKDSHPGNESRIDAITEAIRLWPQPSLYQERAIALQSESISAAPQDFRKIANLAILDYQRAEELHPYDPGPAINRANLLSQLEQDTDAQEAYGRAIQLQGGMEPAFRSHFLFAVHLLRKGLRQFDPEDPVPTLDSMEIAAQQIEKAAEQMHRVTHDIKESRVSIHESLGAAREASGDYQGAMEAYDFASKLDFGARAHYRAAVLNGKIAIVAWSKRKPGEALGYFIEAKNRLNRTPDLPQGVTLSQRADYLAYLDQTIGFLKGAKIDPVSPGSPKP
jgi:tetratricopeptide (TPR) repeat protein